MATEFERVEVIRVPETLSSFIRKIKLLLRKEPPKPDLQKAPKHSGDT
jgi:hypothetical protein